MKKVFWKFGRPVVAVAGCLTAVCVAHAAVYYSNPNTIFVGKGDYQTVCALNNSQAQAGLLASTASDWLLDSVVTTHYDVTCEWETVTGGKTPKVIPHSVTTRKSTAIETNVATLSLKSGNQVTGMFLTLSAPESAGQAPEVGDGCPSGGDGVVTKVEVVGETPAADILTVICPSGNLGSMSVSSL